MKIIPVVGPKGRLFEAKVDDEDFDRLSQYHWLLMVGGNGTIYVGRRVYVSHNYSYTKFMHRDVANTPDGFLKDHRNNDTLDNRRSNLRVCNHSQNAHNESPKGKTSAFKGVSRHQGPAKPWQSKIRVGGKRLYLGTFETEQEAAEAYRAASLKYHGDFSYFRSKENGHEGC